MLGNTIILNLHWASVYLIATGLFFWGKSGVPNIDKKKKTHTQKKKTHKKKNLHHQWVTSSLAENYTSNDAFIIFRLFFFFFFVAYWLFPSQDAVSNVFPLIRSRCSCRIMQVNFEFEPPFWKINDGLFNIIVLQYYISSKYCSIYQRLLCLYPGVIRVTGLCHLTLLFYEVYSCFRNVLGYHHTISGTNLGQRKKSSCFSGTGYLSEYCEIPEVKYVAMASWPGCCLINFAFSLLRQPCKFQL